MNGKALGIAALVVFGAMAGTAVEKYTSIRPGQLWLDTDGKPIQCHGSSIIQVGDTFWWYGENKEKMDGKRDNWHWGMRVYSSKDLYNWKDEGLFIEPDENAPKNAMRNPRSYSDRPHIIYNERTKKFVCWVKVMQEGNVQTMTIFTADKITGPYTEVKAGFKPDGFGSGDFDLVKEDGKAYIVYEVPHSQLNVSQLSDDFCGTVGKVTTHFRCPGPPFTREAPAHFVRHGKHFLFTSGTTGYWPNPSLVAEASSVAGPWKDLGLAARGDTKETTFDCQVSSVFKVPFKKDCYIAVGDRWLPDYPCTYAQTSNAFVVAFKEIKSGPDKEAADKFWALNKQHPTATCNARYVWLPVKFDGERPYLEWRDEWKLDEFEDEK